MPRRNRTPKHQPFIDANPCGRKRRFISEDKAREAISLQELQNSTLRLTTYKCERCSGWHLASQKS